MKKPDRTALCDLSRQSAHLDLRGHIDPILRRADVLRSTGLSQSALYRLIRAGEFPQPVALTENTNGWRQSEVISWIDARPRVTGGAM